MQQFYTVINQQMLCHRHTFKLNQKNEGIFGQILSVTRRTVQLCALSQNDEQTEAGKKQKSINYTEQ